MAVTEITADPSPRRLSAGRPPGIATDRVFRVVTLLSGLLILVILALIIVSTVNEAWPWFESQGLERDHVGRLEPVGRQLRGARPHLRNVPGRVHRDAHRGPGERRHRALRHRSGAAAHAPSDRLPDRPARRDAVGRLRPVDAARADRTPRQHLLERVRRVRGRSHSRRAVREPECVGPGVHDRWDRRRHHDHADRHRDHPRGVRDHPERRRRKPRSRWARRDGR